MGKQGTECKTNNGQSRLQVCFSPDLDFFLSRGRDRCFDGDLSRRASVKDIIESFGIPHTEVGGIRFDGIDKDFGFIPERPGRVEVSGIEPPLDVFSTDRFRPDPLPSIKFVADLNVLKLGQYLLFLGYDTVLARDLSDAGIADLARDDLRIVLTRDTRLLFRKTVAYARRIRSEHPMDQLAETIGFFGLRPDPAYFLSRCVNCNVRLGSVAKEEIFHRLEPKTQKYVHRFHRCPDCGHIYWAGSHYNALSKKFAVLRGVKGR